MKTALILLVSLFFVACGEDYTPPVADVGAVVGGCAYPVPVFEKGPSALQCNTDIASSAGDYCFWPCANYDGVCGATLEVWVSPVDGETLVGHSPVASPWCN